MAAVAAAAVTIVAVRDGGAHPSATVPTLAGVSTTKPTTQAPTTAAPGPAPSTTSAGAPPSAAPQPLQPTPGNLLANGDFERDLGGWSLLGNSRVDRVAVAHSGTWAVRISANRPEPGQPRSQRPGILADHAFQPEQDNSYQAAAWFRASTPGTEAMLALREYGADGETSADVIGVTLPDAGWHEVTVVHRVQHPGARLTLEATAVDLRPDADLLVDQVSITAS